MRAGLRAICLGTVILCAACSSDPPRDTLKPAAEGDSVAVLNTQLGVEYLRQGAYDTALARLERAISIDPSYAPAHDALGLLYAQLKRPVEADGYFRKSIELQPENSGALNNYGQFLCSQGKAREGLEYFDRALNNPLYGTPENAQTNAGLCLVAADDDIGAAVRFAAALEANPQMAPALIQLCRINFEQGDHLRARAYLQRYTAVTKPGPTALWLGVQIERALGDKDAEFSYAVALRDGFPDSPEAQALAELQRQPQP